MKLFVLLLAMIASPAMAADWWWVEGEPNDEVISFVDAESVTRTGERASVRVAAVDRSGQVIERALSLSCDGPQADGAQRFACGTDAERVRWAAMLGPAMSPRDAARALFASARAKAVKPQRSARPQTSTRLMRG